MGRSEGGRRKSDPPSPRLRRGKGRKAEGGLRIRCSNGSLLRYRAGGGILVVVSVQEIIEQIKALPASERAEVTKFVVESDDSWVPASFKQGMSDAPAG